MSELTQFVANLEKAELHVHIEGTLEPQQMFDLASANRIELPYDSPHEVRQAYAFSNLQEFLDLYYLGVNALQTPMDFDALATAYFTKAQADNIHHIEFFFDPQAHLQRGIAIGTLMSGLTAACERGRAAGLRIGIIACFLRHLSETDALKTLELLLPYRSVLTGIGLDSSEVGHPPSKFSQLFNEARSLGLKLVAHAGEEGPPEYVWEALDVLGVDRIDHGNRAMEDAGLMRRLRDDQIPLTLCPLSNLALCVVDDLAHHPLKKMLDAGLLVTVNSDDPAYFGGYLNDNYLQIAQALELDLAELAQLAQNSFTAAFDLDQSQ